MAEVVPAEVRDLGGRAGALEGGIERRVAHQVAPGQARTVGPWWGRATSAARAASNLLEVIEQITYLLFIRRLDDLNTLEENKANRLKQPMARRIFPEGRDAKGRAYEDYRWSRFKHFAPADMFSVVGEHLFPYLRADLARCLRPRTAAEGHNAAARPCVRRADEAMRPRMHTARRVARAFLILLLAAGATSAWAATFIVNSAADTTDGSCDASPGGCTLREAIEASVATPGRDTIAFDGSVFPKSAALTQIVLTTPLPIVADPAGTVVDGGKAGVEIIGNGSVAEGLVFASAPGMPLVKVTVANVIVAGFTGTAVHICGGTPPTCDQDVSGTLVQRVVASQTTNGDGIRVEGRVNSKTRVLDSVAFHIGDTGIRLFATQSLVSPRIQGATVRDCGETGIFLRSTGDLTGATILDTAAVENAQVGVAVGAPTIVKPKIANLVAHGNGGTGIVVAGDDAPSDTITNATISQSTASNNSNAGIVVEGASSTTGVSLADVAVTGSGSWGVLFDGPSAGVTIAGAVVIGNVTDGVLFGADGTGVAIAGTTVADNRGNGLDLRLVTSTVQARASANDADGIVLEASTDDIAGAPGATVTKSSTGGNGGVGVHVANNGIANVVEKNVSLGNTGNDLQDDNTSCGSDTWSGNTFRASNDPCVH
jgi:CSLREA domain-containing protein